jgi:hypothetical protein
MKEKNRLIDIKTYFGKMKVPMIIIIFCFISPLLYGTQSVWVRPYEIKFNYNETGQSNDAVTIRKADGTTLTVPEWKYNIRKLCIHKRTKQPEN